MRYAKVRLAFQRMPENRILIRVWIGSSLWRWRIVPEEENFSSLLRAVAEIDRNLDHTCDYSEGPFFPEVKRQVESIRRGIKQLLADKAAEHISIGETDKA